MAIENKLASLNNCVMCKEIFNSKPNLDFHIKTKHLRMFVCTKCPHFSTLIRARLNRHLTKTHNVSKVDELPPVKTTTAPVPVPPQPEPVVKPKPAQSETSVTKEPAVVQPSAPTAMENLGEDDDDFRLSCDQCWFATDSSDQLAEHVKTKHPEPEPEEVLDDANNDFSAAEGSSPLPSLMVGEPQSGGLRSTSEVEETASVSNLVEQQASDAIYETPSGQAQPEVRIDKELQQRMDETSPEIEASTKTDMENQQLSYPGVEAGQDEQPIGSLNVPKKPELPQVEAAVQIDSEGLSKDVTMTEEQSHEQVRDQTNAQPLTNVEQISETKLLPDSSTEQEDTPMEVSSVKEIYPTSVETADPSSVEATSPSPEVVSPSSVEVVHLSSVNQFNTPSGSNPSTSAVVETLTTASSEETHTVPEDREATGTLSETIPVAEKTEVHQTTTFMQPTAATPRPENPIETSENSLPMETGSEPEPPVANELARMVEPAGGEPMDSEPRDDPLTIDLGNIFKTESEADDEVLMLAREAGLIDSSAVETEVGIKAAEFFMPTVETSKNSSDNSSNSSANASKFRIRCNLCDYSTTVSSLMDNHLGWDGHFRLGQENICQHCTFAASTKEEYLEHGKLHSGSFSLAEWECLICGFKTCQSETFQAHMKETH